MANLQDIAALGTTPIPGDSPTGISARYDPEYEQVQAEIEKLQSVSGAPVLWGEVVKLSGNLLSTKTKDLLLAAYVTSGLLAENGYPGLAAGLNFTKDLVATFWEKLFPEKMRAREGAAKWLDERCARMVGEIADSPGEGDREPLTACVTALEAINALFGEKFTDQPIGLSELKAKVEDKLYSIPEPQAAAPADASGGGEGGASAEGGAPAVEAAPPPPAEIDSPERAREEMQKALDYLKRANVADPFAWQLHRLLLWGGLAEVPDPMPAGGDATLAPAWDAALKKKEYQRVLDEAEARVATDPLWLDLNLYVVRAMEGLGDLFEKAREALTGQVAAFVRRFPDLPGAVFEGGVPAAGEVTRQWIEHEVFALKKKPVGENGNRMDGTMEEARKLATRGKLPVATAMVQKELASVPPGRARFLWRLNLARLCADSGKPLFAVPQLEALDAEAERGGLEGWEPELAVEVVKLLWQCYSSLSKTGGEAMADKASRAYARLCRLDLTTAMSLDGKK